MNLPYLVLKKGKILITRVAYTDEFVLAKANSAAITMKL
jgi:hypothetical protein